MDIARMGFTVFLGNLPAWVTKDDIKSWLTAENLVADDVKVIRNPETQESKGFAFIEAPNQEEMQSIIRRFDRAPLEDRLLRANPAQPPKSKRPGPQGPMQSAHPAPAASTAGAPPADRAAAPPADRMGDRNRRPRSGDAAGNGKRRDNNRRTGQQSAFAEELAKAL